MNGSASARCVELLDRRVAERAAEHAAVADLAHERARVDAGERDDAALAQPAGELGPRVAHDDALALHALRLHPRLVDAVGADQRVREAEHLRDVARIGDRLLVAGHRGREAGLARGDAGRADADARKDGAVLEDEMLHTIPSNVHNTHIVATVAILGSAGYTGQETLDRVLRHPGLELVALGSDSLAGRPAQALDPGLNGDVPMFAPNVEAAASGADVIFLCLGNEQAAAFQPPDDDRS